MTVENFCELWLKNEMNEIFDVIDVWELFERQLCEWKAKNFKLSRRIEMNNRTEEERGGKGIGGKKRGKKF